MSHRHEPSPESIRAEAEAAIVQNRAFIELARLFVSGDTAIISSALPIVVRGALVPSGAVLDLSTNEGVLVAAHGVPLKLRAYLEEPIFTANPDFLGRKTLAHRHAIVDGDVFGKAVTPGAMLALEEAAWECAISVPIRAGSTRSLVLLTGVRRAAAASTVAFLEASANLLSACSRPVAGTCQ